MTKAERVYTSRPSKAKSTHGYFAWREIERNIGPGLSALAFYRRLNVWEATWGFGVQCRVSAGQIDRWRSRA